MYNFDPVGDPALTEAQKAKVIGLVAEMWGEQINSGVVEQRIFPHALAVSERGWSSAAHFEPEGGRGAEFYVRPMSFDQRCSSPRVGVPRERWKDGSTR